MKSVKVYDFGDNNVLKISEGNLPTINKNEVVVNVKFAGVNPADTYIRTGDYSFFKPNLPYIPGFDGSGIIEQVGENVTDLKKGDRVFVVSTVKTLNTGTYAEKVICDFQSIRKLPSFLSFEQGASLGIAAITAYRALVQRGNLISGETVLIHGASGGVGSIAIQIAKYLGAKVIGTAGTKKGEVVIKDKGADIVLNHKEKDYLNSIENVDLIIEMAANINLEKDLDILKKYGRLVIVGNRGEVNFNPRLTMEKEADILGMAIWNANEKETTDCLNNIKKLIDDRAIEPVVGEIFDINYVQEAHKKVLEEKYPGKLLLKL